MTHKKRTLIFTDTTDAVETDIQAFSLSTQACKLSIVEITLLYCMYVAVAKPEYKYFTFSAINYQYNVEVIMN